MAIEYATKYADAALNAFKLGSVTEVFAAQYDWTGAKTVTVFTNATASMADYVPSAGYGTPGLIGNTKDDMTVSKDRKFVGLLDRLDMESVNGTLRAGEWLAKQIREQVTPDVDKYRFLALHTACPSGQISASAAITSANAYTAFLTGNETLDEAEVPTAGRVAFVTPAVYNKLKLDANFVKASELAQSQIIFNGQIGEVDGVPIIKVPSSIMNATDKHMDFIIVHTAAVAAPIKLADYQIVESSERYSGSLVNGRIAHDLFLLDTLNTGIYIHVHA
jgi:N4-gp56 family major capsid protein